MQTDKLYARLRLEGGATRRQLLDEFYKDPMDHPRWDEQVALEKSMMALGEDKAKARLDEARRKGNMSDLRPQRSIIKDLIIPVADYLAHWVEENGKKTGQARPIAQRLLVRIPPETAAVCALRTIFKKVGQGSMQVLYVADQIGTWLEHEAQAIAWSKVDEKSWNATVKKYTKQGADAVHQRRARINLFNKHIREDIGWTDWTSAQRQRVGLALIDCVKAATMQFEIIPDPQWHPKRTKAIKSRPYVLIPTPELLRWLKNATDQDMVFQPTFLPTIIPPKPWVDARDGGYWTPFVKTPFLIRFKAMHQDQKRNALDEYESLHMPEVYKAVNTAQEAAWKINRRVYEVAKYCKDHQIALKTLPVARPEDILRRTPDEKALHDLARDMWDKMSVEEKEANPQIIKPYREWSRKATAIHKRNAQLASRLSSIEETFTAVGRLVDEPVFYFPHMLDFRGRLYPIPSAISPQGNDLHKGLLLAAYGKRAGPDGATWLAINLANAHGVDKVNLLKRIEWVREREDLWRAIAADPYTNCEWMQADKGDSAWQALAAIFEWVGFLEDPENFVSHLPIRVDGSCNGIQHLSAMVRDLVGGEAVNLVPSEEPQDIYSRVAKRVDDALNDDAFKADGEDDIKAQIWLSTVEGKVPRSMTKRPVMIVPYGGTIHAFFDYTMEWLEELDPNHAAIQEDEAFKMVGYIVRKINAALDGQLGRSKEVMKWIQDNCKLACKDGKPLTWRTPSGFYCRQFYGQLEARRVNTLIDGQRIFLVSQEATNKMDHDAQATAIAPNYVHSMDASCLTLTINKSRDRGLGFITTIHDSIGALAADMWTLYDTIRAAFVENYSEDVLAEFQEYCKFVNPKATAWPELLPMGELDLELVKQSDYFFA